MDLSLSLSQIIYTGQRDRVGGMVIEEIRNTDLNKMKICSKEVQK
jgi:hypothetical protein